MALHNSFFSSCRYCRCVIFSHTAGKLLLLAADYGLTFETPFEEVSAPPPDMEDLRTLAYQAIECHLPTVTPSGAEWDDRSGDLIWDTLGQSFRVYAKVNLQTFLSLRCCK